MKWWKKILLVLFVVIILAQIPFIYRRFQTGKLADNIANLQTQRINLSNPNFNEYKGIIHAHTNLGGHSTIQMNSILS
jgi:cell division protein FtsL